MRWIPSTFCTKDKFKNKGTSQTFLFRISVKRKNKMTKFWVKKSTSHNRWHWLKVNAERTPLFFCKMGNYNGMEVPNGGSRKLWLIEIDDSFTFESCKLHRYKDSWIKNVLTGLILTIIANSKFFSFQIMIWRRMIQGFWSFGFTSESKQLAI